MNPNNIEIKLINKNIIEMPSTIKLLLTKKIINISKIIEINIRLTNKNNFKGLKNNIVVTTYCKVLNVSLNSLT